MSTMPPPPPPPAGVPAGFGGARATLDVSGTQQVPFARLVAVELRKACDTAAGFWLLIAIAGLVSLVEVIVLIASLLDDAPVEFGTFTGVSAELSGFLLPVLGIMLVTSEWGQRTAMVTFALEPRRVRIVLAKLVAGLLITIGAIVVALAVGLMCTLVCDLFHPDQTSWNMQLDQVAGFAVTQMLTMIGGFALATLLLNTPAAIVLFYVYTLVLPGLIAVFAALLDVFDTIGPWINYRQAAEPVSNWAMDTGEEWGQFIVSGCIWIVLPFVLGLFRILRAEVK